MLSNCAICRLGSESRDECCSISPDYWRLWQAVSAMPSIETHALPIGDCDHYVPDPQLLSETYTLTLSRADWQELSQCSSLSVEARSQIQAALRGLTEPEAEEIRMIPVQSSNLRAIGYCQSRCILQVDFLSDHRYQYFHVPPALFEEMLQAESKGRFLHNRIKSARYTYSPVVA